jgi:hypothetical protein
MAGLFDEVIGIVRDSAVKGEHSRDCKLEAPGLK